MDGVNAGRGLKKLWPGEKGEKGGGCANCTLIDVKSA